MSDPVTRLNTALEGRYSIERELGEGGMATVYLAKDLQHDRSVAIKVLRPEIGAVIGADRFLAEIRTTANLQHPHILALYDSGAADGLLYYVMPHVRGESLRHKLDREKQLPIEEAVSTTREVADALDYAHRQGVIHRDIKPENVLLQDGRALVADFGIALAVTAAGGARLTETGLSLGTPAYMSPEQATGDRVVDGRTDIYALGCLLYEMLAGQPPHVASTAQAVLAKVLTAHPERLGSQRRTVPRHIDLAVQKALERLPADRFRSPDMFARALTGALELAGPGDPRRRVGISLVVAAAAVGALLGYVGGRAYSGEESIGPQVARQLTFVGAAHSPALSPSGQFVAYEANICGPGESCRATYWVQDLEGGDPIRIRLNIPDLPEGVDPWYAFAIEWSPDESTLVISVRHEEARWSGLYLVPRFGGMAEKLDGGFATSSSYRPNQNVVDWIAWPDGFEGEAHWRSLDLDTDSLESRVLPFRSSYHQWSLDGRWLALIGEINTAGVNVPLRILNAEGELQDERSLPQMGGWPRAQWGSDGEQIYFSSWNSTTILRIGIDPNTGKMRGELDSIASGLGEGEVDVTPDGRRAVYTYGDVRTELRFEERGADGRITQGSLPSGVKWRRLPAISPDGDFVAFTREDLSGINIYIQDLEGGDARAVTGTRDGKERLRWSPDGEHIAYVRYSPDGNWTMTASRSADRPQTVGRIHLDYSAAPAWLPDSRRLVFPADTSRLVVADIDGEADFSLLAPPDSFGLLAEVFVSPRGDSVAAIAERFGPEEISVTGLIAPLEAGDVKWTPLFTVPRADLLAYPHEQSSSSRDDEHYSAGQWLDDGRLQFVFSYRYGRSAYTTLWEVVRAERTVRFARDIGETCGALAVVSFSRDQSRMVCDRSTWSGDVWLVEGLAN